MNTPRPSRHGAPHRRIAAASVAAALTVAGLTGACGTAHTARPTITAASIDGGAGFEPATITVHKTDKVKLTVRNTTAKTHGFTIVGYGIRREVPSDAPIEVNFTASRAGTYEIRCQLHPTHATATLVVE